MAELGVALITFAPARTQDFVTLGRRAEEAGYAACYTTESLTDTLSIDLAILLGTSRIRVGSYVAVSYLRHPIIAAQMAVTASDLSGGRFVLGLGLGHRTRLSALGVASGTPSVDLPAYVTDVKAVLDGRGRERYPDLPPQTTGTSSWTSGRPSTRCRCAPPPSGRGWPRPVPWSRTE
jgi:5,10-methylenetetrahydromethanopterin reductase